MQPIGTTALVPAKNSVMKDFNGDFLKDYLVLDIAAGSISIYKNNNPGFSLAYSSPITGSLDTHNSIDAADFNGDGMMDIIVCYGGVIKILKNINNTFSFNLANTINVVANYKTSPTYLKVDDLNGDNAPDFILTGSHLNSNHGVAFFAYRNAAPASFSFALEYSNLLFYGSPSLDTTRKVDVCIGDVDATNGKDLLYTYGEKQDTMVFLQNTSTSTLNFNMIKKPILPIQGGFTSDLCEMADFDSDGRSDFVTISKFSTSSQINLYFGNTSFSASPIQSFPISVSLTDFKLTDINTDSYPDFVGISGSTLLVYVYDPINGKFKDNTPINIGLPANTNVIEMSVADYDNNFFQDIILKAWNGLAGIPRIIPNFAHYVTIASTNTNICSGNSVTLTASGSVTLSPLTYNYNWYFFGTPTPFATGSTAVTSTAGIHYVILSHSVPFSNGFNCNYTGFPQMISVAPNPTIVVVAAQPTVCSGSFAYFNASGAESYTWFPAMDVNTSFSFQASPTNYSVVVQGEDSNGCLDTAIAKVYIHPAFINNISASKDPVCVGDSVFLYLPGATSYTWSVPNINAPALLFFPKNSTMVMVDFKDMNGCMASRTIQVNINTECDLKIYTLITPNGDNNNDFLFLENIERFKDNHVTIYNRWGLEIFDQRNYDNVNRVWPGNNTNNLTPGTYYYIINLGNGTTRKGWIEIIKS
ncbi:MAG: hypothetical protein K0S32_1241 [Bacteroidetes bacterium]|jgi:gliding motility-associated-like protein|nr:hypothetical protein [Bacteroidota bacterium]